MLQQKLQQKLLQKLSPQQILLMKLLQIPTVALEQRIKQEIEENPALDETLDTADSEEENETQENEPIDNFEDSDEDKDKEENDRDSEEFSLTDYMDEDEIPAYRLQENNTSPDDERREIPFISTVSFQEYLISQIGMRALTEKQQSIALTIIGNLDDSGYIQRSIEAMADDLAFSQNITATKEEILEVLLVIQDFDPPGVGARNLQECLLIQLKRKKEEHPESPALQHAAFILERYFNEFTKRHYDKIIHKARITEEELKGAIEEILKLNPKPGDSLIEVSRSNFYIIPDFIIQNKDGGLELILNSKNVPELRLSRTYLDMLETYAHSKKKNNNEKEAFMFIKQKIDSAKWFIDAIRQRQNTLYVTMHAIMEYQKDYFLTGDETKLHPMILKDIAEIVSLDISTISRVANSKYVQTPFGTFLLKSFFSESLQNQSGEEVSTREIKKILTDCIDSEEKQKPLTDDQLTKILMEKGYNIARRTVAKYREQLDIPVARLRRELA
ncbi:MAG: RNA polymerase factor sigma-54 [Bacteroidetes bacterium]|nr:RNA polymerase factor sigma-54 [Bacteroidota bacterium]